MKRSLQYIKVLKKVHVVKVLHINYPIFALKTNKRK